MECAPIGSIPFRSIPGFITTPVIPYKQTLWQAEYLEFAAFGKSLYWQKCKSANLCG